MQEMLVMTPAYARPYRLSGWRWGGRAASGDGSVRAIYLGGKLRGSVAFGNRVFLAGNHISDEQRDKEQERAREKRRRNLGNLSEESLERSR